MISSLQNRRPMARSGPQPQPPLNQQPHRNLSSTDSRSAPTNSPFVSSHPPATFPPASPFHPRTQIEALPPTQQYPHQHPYPHPQQTHQFLNHAQQLQEFQQFQAAAAQQQMKTNALLDPAMRHPVFFTERLKKAPNGVDCGDGNRSGGGDSGRRSPIVKGYVFEDGVGRGAQGNGVKL